jgi:benzoyl-CoA reductase/2-hydroxyglutaryl-CoA dehydratase subunit BcrC/BadD/HgdB
MTFPPDIALCYHPRKKLEMNSSMNELPNIPSRREVAEAFKEQGGSIAGVLPIHYPRALLRSFHFLPMEVWGPPNVSSTFGEAHLQPYLCSIVRNALSFIQTEPFEIVDLLLVPHACDSLQGLGSILLDFLPPTQPMFPLYLPRGNGKNGINYFSEEIRSLFRKLEDLTGLSPSDDEVRESIQLEEKADEVLATLHHKRRMLGLSNYDFYKLIRSREFLPAESFTELAQKVLERVENQPSSGIPLIFSGILPEPMHLLHSIDEMGGLIVADDLACCGRRLYPPGQSENVFQRMAESILNAPPDWSRGSSIQSRLTYMIEQSKLYGAKGVIFYNVKFCEPELFDLPMLREGLREKGIQSTMLEIDINDPVSNQLLTRVEAFLEILE